MAYVQNNVKIRYSSEHLISIKFYDNIWCIIRHVRHLMVESTSDAIAE